MVTNTVCGHPKPGEDLAEAVRRRARSELGVEVRSLRLVLPDFRYRAVMNGLVEHELCPVFVGFVDDDALAADPQEVDDAQWVPWEQFRREVLSGDAHRSRPGAPSRCRCSTPSAPTRSPGPPARAPSCPRPPSWAPTPRRREAAPWTTASSTSCSWRAAC